jgi:endoglucanase
VSQADPANKRNDFGYDAIRVYWRLSVDALVYHQQQAWPLLTPGLKTLEQYVAAKKRLPGPLSYTGGERALLDSEALVGTLYPLALAKQPAFGQQLGQQWVAGHLAPYLLWLPDTDYYANNWYWFGLALALYPYQPAVVPKGGSPLLGVGANCQ